MTRGILFAVGERMRPPRTNLYAPQVEQIRRMKTAAESGPARTADGVANGAVMTRGGWFKVGAIQAPNTVTVVPGGTPQAEQPPGDKKPTEKGGQQ